MSQHAPQSIMMVPRASSMAPVTASPTPTIKKSPLLQNVQFFIVSAHGLSEPKRVLPHLNHHRVVRVSCNSEAHQDFHVYPSLSYTWKTNSPEIGPVVDSDKITFIIELHLPFGLKHLARTSTVACSAPYSVETLLKMQTEAKDESISIPLNDGRNHSDAFLLLHVKQPSADFIFKWHEEEALRLHQEKEARRRLLASSNHQG